MKFRAADFSPGDAPRSHGPVEVGSDHTETVIENNQHYTVGEIADTLKISKSTKLLAIMKNVFYFTERNHRDFLANPVF